jgi:hypothetical protein
MVGYAWINAVRSINTVPTLTHPSSAIAFAHATS